MGSSTAAKGGLVPFTVPPLAYPFDALEPHIDKLTMEIHHDKHHGAYVANLNKALESAPEVAGRKIEDLLANNCNIVPENIRTAVRNNGGGHANHSLFWTLIGPKKGGEPKGRISEVINETFGGFAQFKEKFAAAATTRFGSGWAWFARDFFGNLEIYSTANQDSPLMDSQTPLLGIDVWEHAYYLKYQNLRPKYLTEWWNVCNWDEVAKRYEAARR